MTLTDKYRWITLLQKLEEEFTKLQKLEDVIVWQFIKFVVTLNDLMVDEIHQSTHNLSTRSEPISIEAFKQVFFILYPEQQ